MRSIRTIGAVAMTAALCHTHRAESKINNDQSPERTTHERSGLGAARAGIFISEYVLLRSALAPSHPAFEGASASLMRASSVAPTIAGCEPPASVREGPGRRTEAAR